MGHIVVEIFGGAGHGPRMVQVEGSVQVGRAPDNNLVLQDPEVSWRHALVYDEGGEIWVRDLGSRNGTLVDGQPIASPTRLGARSRLRIGSVDLSVRRPAPKIVPLLLEEAGTGVRHPLLRERYVIGPEEGADLRSPDLEEPITLLLPGHGEVWVGFRGEDWPLELGAPQEVGGFAFSVLAADPHRVPTVEASGSPYAYALTATLEGGPGPLAVIRDLSAGHEGRFTAETRAILLFTLGRQICEDREAGCPHSEEGWVADPDLVVAVWGRTPLSEGLARLKTLIHRVRGDCRDAGLDPWCVEKRKGHTRLRVQDVTL